MEEIQPGIFSQNGNLYTENQVSGEKVYGESLQNIDGVEFRAWHANRSKVAAAVKNGIDLGIHRVMMFCISELPLVLLYRIFPTYSMKVLFSRLSTRRRLEEIL